MKYLYLSVLLLIGTFVFGVTLVYAIFKSSATSANNTFTAAAIFPTPTQSITPTNVITPTVPITPTQPATGSSSLVINEVSAVGGDASDWIEIYNLTNSNINVSNWQISDNNGTDLFPGESSIPANGFAVIVASGSAISVPAGAQKIILATSDIGGNGLNPTSDRVILRNSLSQTIDTMSFGGDITVFSLSGLTGAQVLFRHPNGYDTNTAGDWLLGSSSIGVSNP